MPKRNLVKAIRIGTGGAAAPVTGQLIGRWTMDNVTGFESELTAEQGSLQLNAVIGQLHEEPMGNMQLNAVIGEQWVNEAGYLQLNAVIASDGVTA